MIASLANSTWLAASLAEHARFRRALGRVQAEQSAILTRILRTNASTAFGKANYFTQIRSVEDFRERVPITTYAGHSPWIDRAANAEPHVLTAARVRLFEPTGGSSGGPKLIPYTASLAAEFQRGIQSWIADLFLHNPALMIGPAYWSVSPVTHAGPRQTAGGIPIGFEDDTAYAGGWKQHLVQAVMAVPASVRLISDLDTFRSRTLLHLIRARTLRLISVWHPSFLTLLLDHLRTHADHLAHDLAHGNGCPADPARARELRAIHASSTSPAELHRCLWPHLRLISCWQDANAALPARALAALFPQASLQGKGLIATEAFISLPLHGREDCALAVRSHFLEFELEGSDRTLLAHELERGQRVSVIVTTGGGLYRYRLGDQVEVTGHLDACPLIRFLGRDSLVSDWFGEKLTEAHVAKAFAAAWQHSPQPPAFALLACALKPLPAYTLYLESDAPPDADVLYARAIEAELLLNFHYSYARQLQQLGPIRVLRIQNGAARYTAECLRRGQGAGDIKLPALDRGSDWTALFTARERHTTSRYTRHQQEVLQ